ncbi:MAG: tRNA threonylcarbamoyladenosine dehydratase [Clostridia bacterium]|nr:tRNA threonylcarbamoyladenosine dehydratase [Clostridia bacterium]
MSFDDSRTRMLIGDGADLLRSAKVIVFGLGGVGGYVAEFLARAGVGCIGLVDNDTISRSNFNRQLLATKGSEGVSKTRAAAERIASVNPDVAVREYNMFFTKDSELDLSEYDCCADCIDTVSSKIELAVRCEGVTKLVSCMGTGNKLRAHFKAADIYSTSVCPLARVMRRELKRAGVKSLRVVYSEEQPLGNTLDEGGRHIPGSISYVPAAAACVIAEEIISSILGDRRREILR